MVLAKDIRIHYSGGTNNKDPNLSIGGKMSNYLVPSNVFKNVWSPLTLEQTVFGYTRYRLLYVENLSVEPFIDVHLYTPVMDSPPGTTLIGYTSFEWSHIEPGHVCELLPDETTEPSEAEIGHISDEPAPWNKTGQTYDTTLAVVHAIPTQSFLGIWLRQVFLPPVPRAASINYYMTLEGGEAG